MTEPSPQPPATPPRDTPATTAAYIGPYRVVREIGAGGMGRVHLAASRSGRALAVKVVRPELAADPDFRRRFRAEVDAVRRVSGAFTAPVVDADPDGPLPWLATAYVPGPSLAEAIDSHGPMPEATLRVLGGGLAEALAAIHRAGLVHRDLKPSNILLTPDGPRVIDFGISRTVDATALTAEGQVVGSPGYMSPEQARGDRLTSACDVFAFGAVLVLAATGHPPFGTGAAHALLYRAAHEEPRLDGVPHSLLGIVAACLEKDPARRPGVGQLQSWLRTETTAGWLGTVEPQVAEAQRALRDALRTPLISRRRLLAGGVLAAVAAGGTTWYLSLRDRDTPATPELAWTRDLPRPGMSLRASTKATVLCAHQASLACLDRRSGKLLWQTPDDRTTDVLTDERHVYTVRPDGKVHALDGRSGREVWSAAPDEDSAPRLAFSDGDLVVTVSGGRVQGVAATSGEVRWSASDVPDADAVVRATPAGALVIRGSPSKVSPAARLRGHTALDRDSGKRLWSRDLVALHVPGEGEVLFGLDDDMRLLALDPETGRTLWSEPTELTRTNATFFDYGSSLSLNGGTLFCHSDSSSGGTGGGVFTAFDPNSGKSLWNVVTTSSQGSHVHARSGSTVCYLDAGTLHGLNADTGARRWTVEKPGRATTSLLSLGTLFLTADQLGLRAFVPESGKEVWHFATDRPDGSWGLHAQADHFCATWSGRLFRFTLLDT